MECSLTLTTETKDHYLNNKQNEMLDLTTQVPFWQAILLTVTFSVSRYDSKV